MKIIFFLIHLGLATCMVWQTYQIFNPSPETSKPAASGDHGTDKTANTPVTPGSRKPKTQTGMENAIAQRNLFKVNLDQTQAVVPKKEQKTDVLPEKTKLKLTLWGTVESKTPSQSWAVIEDKKNRRQDLYKIGDQVMGAQIKKIFRNRIILMHNGKEQMLEAETKPSPGTPGKLPSPIEKLGSLQPEDISGGPFQALNKDENKAPNAMLAGLKSRPYIKQGNPEGLLVYGIRPGSALLKMGLKNGDIIRTINDIQIQNSTDLKTTALELEPDQETRITLSRRGREQEITLKGADE